tara:strand:- start:1647 stop:2264 length:618 start_codon:yes stop_codon:yes gene_type:complete
MKTILWDFDGVILDSMDVRDYGFYQIFKKFNSEDIEFLIQYHRKNGGLSRYVKIKYFFEEILLQKISNEEINNYANNFSLIMRQELVNSSKLIAQSINFIKSNYKNYNFHIVSGSDENELKYLCDKLKIAIYFISINGSPTSKNELVNNLMIKYDYDKNETCLIGDSINDYDAANKNNIKFYAFNNQNLKVKNFDYINSFKNFNF